MTELGEIIAEGRDDRLTVGLLDRLLVGRDVRHAIVSSTRGDASEVVALVCSRVGHCLEFNQRTPVPIGNAYRSPETLGLDRLAAAVGAATLFPGRNVLVIDCGTALTIDTVTADGVFRGGCISPGLRMRLRALHDYTAALPLCEPSEWPEPEPNTEPKSVSVRADAHLGRTTEEAIVRGTVQSIVFEIEGHAARFRDEFEDTCVIFTGGDAHFFVKRIKNTIFANCNPVFCGLDRILEYNVLEEYLG